MSKHFLKFLNRIEHFGNKLPNPALLFVIMSLIVIIASHIAYVLGTSVTFESVDPATGYAIENSVYAISLLTGEGIRFIATSFISNFTGFVPVGIVFVIMVGVAVADKSGLLSALLQKVAKITPSRLLSPITVFLGIVSSVASAFGFAVLIPLAALLFIKFKRHPITGMAAAFAGVSGGWAANILIAPNDVVFASITQAAANILNPAYEVSPVGNWYFMIVSTVLITFLGWFATDKIVEPRLGKYNSTEAAEEVSDITRQEKKALKWAGISFLLYFIAVLALIVPQNAVLRNPATNGILDSAFMGGIVFFIMLAFLIPGIVYGIIAKTIRTDHDVVAMMVESIKSISGFLVLIFFSAQFVAYFNYSNIGIIVSIQGSEFLANIGFYGLPLIISIIILTATINIIFAVDTAKWAMMAPIFVPMLMSLGISPEFTQLAYRIGDSTTNMITPLMPFFPMMMAFVQKYDKKAGIGTILSVMMPYNILFLLGWIGLVIIWYFLGWPLGPGAGLVYPPL